MLMQAMMQRTMLVQMIMQAMGDGGVHDSFTLFSSCLSLGKTIFYKF